MLSKIALANLKKHNLIICILIFLFFLNENNLKITNLKKSFNYIHYKNKNKSKIANPF